MTHHDHNHDHLLRLLRRLQLHYSAHNQADLSHENEAGIANEREHENK